MMAERPGIMVYFDMAEPIKGLSYEEKGKLLEAMLEYGQFGVIPEFDGSLSIAWGFIRPRLDADAKRYRKKVVTNTYSSYCAKEKSAGRTPIDRETWLAQEGIDSEWNRTVSSATERHPNSTTNTNSISSTSSTSTSATTSDTASTAEGGRAVKDERTAEDFESLRRQQIAKVAGWK